MPGKTYRIRSRARVYNGYFKLDEYLLTHSLFQGGQSPELSREVLERGHVVALLPYDPDRDRVVLIEQFRPGAMAAGWDPWLIECVAGVIDEGESAEQVAVREAAEETGGEISDLMLIGEFLTSPGAVSETVTLYLGRTRAAGEEAICGLADEGENIRVFSLPRPEALALFDQGRVRNAKTIIALQWLAINGDKVRERWGGG